jgi:NAD(P)-dependent dehydrogenase (short-subunit alcohol dehydrogenase family)
LELDRQGFRVYAGVRRESDAAELRKVASTNLQPVILDVTIPEQVDAVVQQLQEAHGETGIYALVNVAGIADFSPIEPFPIERLKKIFDVNFFSTVALTQKVIPLLRKSKGRIVNVGSVGAHTTIPYGFSICSSKHALESLTSGLRMELAPWDIDVIAVDPSSIATPAAGKMVEQAKNTIETTFSTQDKAHYEKSVVQMAESMHKQEMGGMPPEGVGKVIAKALTAKRPKARYPIGPHSRMIVLMSGILPDRLFDKLKLKMVGIKLTT